MRIENNEEARNSTIARVREAAQKKPRQQGKPKVAFPTPNLVLTEQQEARLVKLIQDEMSKMDRELGRSLTDTTNAQVGAEWYSANGNLSVEQVRVAENSFMGKRQRYEMDFENRRQHRARPKTVFEKSNLTLSTARRIAGQRAARFRRAIFDAAPYFQIDALPIREREFVAQLQVVAETMAHNSRSNSEYQQAITRACVIGEAIIHTRAVKDEDVYEEFQEVLCDDFGEKPVLAGDWDYITPDDVWMPTQEVTPADVQDMAEATPDDMAAPLSAGVDASVLTESLARHPGTTRKGRQTGVDEKGAPIISWEIISPAHDMMPIPANKYRAGVWPKRHTHYEGSKASLVFWRDFMCPLGAPSIEEAICIAHLEALDITALAGQYAENARPDTIATAAEILNSAIQAHSSNDLEHGADVDRPRRELGELHDDTFGIADRTRLTVAHVYIRCDPKNTGITSDIYCLIDTRTWLPIHYNYTAASSPTKKRPYTVVCPNPVNGRWFGQGEMERFEHADNLIDLYLNRAAVVLSSAGFVTFWRPDRTLQGERNPSLQLDPSVTYTPIGQYKPEDIIQRVPLYEGQSPDLLNMMQMLTQSAVNESGTANANDANAAGMDSQKTATGIRSITAAGDEMTSAALANLKEGLSAALSDFVVVCFKTVPEDEVFAIHDGPVARQFTLNKRDIRHLQLSARVLLTSWWNEKITESRRNAIADINAQFLPLSSGTMAATVDMWVDQLNAMGIENAKPMLEAIIADKQMQEQQMALAAQAQPASAA